MRHVIVFINEAGRSFDTLTVILPRVYALLSYKGRIYEFKQAYVSSDELLVCDYQNVAPYVIEA